MATRQRVGAAAVTLGLLLTACGSSTADSQPVMPAGDRRVETTTTSATATSTAPTSTAAEAPATTEAAPTTPPTEPERPVPTTAPAPAPPERISIPSIGVDAPVGRLGLLPDRTLEVPTDWDATGWYEGGPLPGDRGPAVIAGHVDSKSGPAVFYRLDDLNPGDRIDVVADDGSTKTFQVTKTDRYPKGDFPTVAVYGLTPDPELRLITCDGDFDRSSGHYDDNLVVSATLVS